MSYFDEVTGTTPQQRSIYEQNAAALGNRAFTQADLDRAASLGVPLSSPSDPNAAARSGLTVQEAMAARQAQSSPSSSNGVNDYVQMISDAAFGGPSHLTVHPVAPVPAARPADLDQLRAAAAAKAGGMAPIPATPSPQLQQQRGASIVPTAADRNAFDQATFNGVPLEALAAGALGAGVGYIAKSILSSMNSRNNPGGPNPFGDTGAPPAGGETPPRPSSGSNGNGTHDAQGRSVTTSRGNQPNRTVLPSGDYDPQSLQDIIDGDFNVIDEQNQRLFGPSSSSSSSSGDRVGDPRLVTQNGRTVETVNPNRAIDMPGPGPNSPQKMIVDMDSPNYRDLNGTLTEEQRAREIYNAMQYYGDYNPDNYGVTPEKTPGLFDRLTRMIRR